MNPTTFARVLADSGDPEQQALGVAIITRGLTDDDPSDPTRQGWPLDRHTVAAAARYLILDATPTLVTRALALAPTVSDAMLNKGATR